MQSHFIKAIAIIAALALLPAASLAQKTDNTAKIRRLEKAEKETTKLSPKEMEERLKKGRRPGAAKSFHIARIDQDPNRFSALLSDENSRIVNAYFTISQLMLLEVVLEEAQKFAESDDAAGVGKAIITRFYDTKEPSLIIDVAKKGKESQYFITLEGFNGKLTIDGGKINRDKKQEARTGVFYSMIEGIAAAKASGPPQ